MQVSQDNMLLKSVSIPVSSGKINSSSITAVDFVVSPPDGIDYNLNVPLRYQSRLVVDLQFCFAGMLDAAAKIYAHDDFAVLGGQGLAIVSCKQLT